jgi:hypothetical protein
VGRGDEGDSNRSPTSGRSNADRRWCTRKRSERWAPFHDSPSTYCGADSQAARQSDSQKGMYVRTHRLTPRRASPKHNSRCAERTTNTSARRMAGKTPGCTTAQWRHHRPAHQLRMYAPLLASAERQSDGTARIQTRAHHATACKPLSERRRCGEPASRERCGRWPHCIAGL